MFMEKDAAHTLLYVVYAALRMGRAAVCYAFMLWSSVPAAAGSAC